MAKEKVIKKFLTSEIGASFDFERLFQKRRNSDRMNGLCLDRQKEILPIESETMGKEWS
jgi:hypothetical protein